MTSKQGSRQLGGPGGQDHSPWRFAGQCETLLCRWDPGSASIPRLSRLVPRCVCVLGAQRGARPSSCMSCAGTPAPPRSPEPRGWWAALEPASGRPFSSCCLPSVFPFGCTVPHSTWGLSPRPGVEPATSAVEAQIPNL